jgi:hypothetical protein
MVQFPAWLQLPTENYNALSIMIGVLQIFAIIFTAVSISQQRSQLRSLSRQLMLQREAVYISSYSHFNNAYKKVMSEIPLEPADEHQINNWWHRYWDIIIGEVNFCMKGQLDKDIFELWMNELARSYFLPPHGVTYMGTYAENSEARFDLVLAVNSPLRRFFAGLRKCALQMDGAGRAEAVAELAAGTYNLLGPRKS